jgi:hypothetical protein
VMSELKSETWEAAARSNPRKTSAVFFNAIIGSWKRAATNFVSHPIPCVGPADAAKSVNAILRKHPVASPITRFSCCL